VLLELKVGINFFVFSIYHFLHKFRYQLGHLFVFSIIQNKLMIVTCNHEFFGCEF